MNEEPVTDTLLRQFLLGKVDDRERQRIESMFVTGALSKERVIAAEQHLIDDYLDDALTPADREQFLAQYGDTPAAQRKLRIARSIQEWATQSADLTPVANGAASSRWSRLRQRFRLKPVFMIPIAAVSMIAIIFAIVSLNKKWQQRNRRQLMQEEIVRLNSPSASSDDSPRTPALTLMPGTVRSGEAERELTPPNDAEVVDVSLVWTQEAYPSYEATIGRFGEEELYKIPNVRVANGVIRLRLPTRFLTRGLYQIEVSGISANGATSPPEEYKFVVNR